MKKTPSTQRKERKIFYPPHTTGISITNVSTSSKTSFVLYIILTKCLVFSLDNGGLLTRLFVIECRASSILGPTVYLSIMFSLFGLTAGILYWQADTLLQIVTAYCGSSIPSLLFLSSVLLRRINKSLEVSETRRKVLEF